MKLGVATVAVVGALAIGGVPALAFTLAADDHPVAPGTVETDKPGNGPPPHANSRHNVEKSKEQDKDKHKDRGAAHGKAMSSLGRAHGEAMREWAGCVSERVREHTGGEEFDPKDACGDKPAPPGHLKQRS